MKKILGILLILIGILFVLAAIVNLNALFSAVLGIVTIFEAESTGYQVGQIMGGLVYWIVHFLIIYFSLRYGAKLVKRNKAPIS